MGEEYDFEEDLEKEDDVQEAYEQAKVDYQEDMDKYHKLFETKKTVKQKIKHLQLEDMPIPPFIGTDGKLYADTPIGRSDSPSFNYKKGIPRPGRQEEKKKGEWVKASGMNLRKFTVKDLSRQLPLDNFTIAKWLCMFGESNMKIDKAHITIPFFHGNCCLVWRQCYTYLMCAYDYDYGRYAKKNTPFIVISTFSDSNVPALTFFKDWNKARVYAVMIATRTSKFCSEMFKVRVPVSTHPPYEPVKNAEIHKKLDIKEKELKEKPKLKVSKKYFKNIDVSKIASEDDIPDGYDPWDEV